MDTQQIGKETVNTIHLQKGVFSLSRRDDCCYVFLYDADPLQRLYWTFVIGSDRHRQFMDWLQNPKGRMHFAAMVLNTVNLPDQTRQVEIQAWGNRNHLWSIFLKMTPQNITDIIELVKA